jgi:hypothetical protein
MREVKAALANRSFSDEFFASADEYARPFEGQW